MIFTRYCKQVLFLCALFFVIAVQANERQSDPDGCLSCHGLEGLQFIDKKGVLRVASIDKADYFGSLHGSVPCTDCHKMTTYPHDVKEGLVDCAGTCHVNEPSKGQAFTHKPVVKEFQKSTHGHGRVKDFGGGDRLEEDEQQDPSCRRCHSNTPYIPAHQMDKFKMEFEHTDMECGKCHTGEVWMNQFSGHILRRLVGSRWNKQDINKSCNQCHDNKERMAKVKIEDPETKKKNPVSYRWIHSTESYDRTLHSRILVVGDEKGASCLDCHIHHGEGYNGHDILKDEQKLASTHPDQLGKTCGAVGCHEYAKSSFNKGFVLTDVHDINQVHLPDVKALLDQEKFSDPWYWGSILGLLFAIFTLCGSFFWLLLIYPKNKKSADALIGAESFEQVMLGRKPKKAPAKPAAPAGAAKAPALKSTVLPSAVEKTNPNNAEAVIKKPASTSEALPQPTEVLTPAAVQEHPKVPSNSDTQAVPPTPAAAPANTEARVQENPDV